MSLGRVLTTAIAVVTALALAAPVAHAARTPQVRKAYVLDAQYCLILGMRPRVYIELSAPGKVVFSTYSVDPGDPLKIPRQTGGPKTVTLPQGVSVVSFPDALGRLVRDFKPGFFNFFTALPYTGFQIGAPYTDLGGFVRLPNCG